MKTAFLLAALILTPDAPDATYDSAMSGFLVGIEDDEGPDAILTSVATEDCVTRFAGRSLPDDYESPFDPAKLTGPELGWTIDWRDVEWVRMEDDPSFYAVKTRGGRLYGFVTSMDESAAAEGDYEGHFPSDFETNPRYENFRRIASAADAALFLHIACDPGAKARYEARGMRFKVQDKDGNWVMPEG